MDLDDAKLAKVLHLEEDRLIGQFGGKFGSDVVDRHFKAALDSLKDARVKTYIPVLAYRMTRDRLSGLPSQGSAHARGGPAGRQ